MSADDSTFQLKARPQSTMALDFAAALNDLFQIDDGLEELSRNVDQKRRSTTLLSGELNALTSRLRETEVRLKRARRASMRMQSASSSPSQSSQDPDLDSPLSIRTHRSANDSSESAESSVTSGSETGEELKGIEEQEEED